MSQADRPLGDLEAHVDRDLLADVGRRSTDSLGRLYDRHAATVYGLARRIVRTGEDAEEVVQDVFAQVWRDAGRYDASRATVAGWLVMLTKARAIDRLRARRARPDVGGQPAAPVQVSSPGPTPEACTISAEEARRVRAALETLPETQRAVIDLAFYEGLTHSEIAGRTGLPLGTVKTRLRAAMAVLRGAIAP